MLVGVETESSASLVAALRSPHQRLRVDLTLRIGRDGTVVGRARGTAAPAATA